MKTTRRTSVDAEHRGNAAGSPAAALVVLAVLLAPGPATATSAPGGGGGVAAADTLELTECELSGTDRTARCGTLEVPEDRASREGRRIGLRVVVLPAREPPAAADPVFFLAGGPGQAATADAGGAADHPLGERRDLVFVDLRGTGGSRPLGCDLGGAQATAEAYLAGRMPPERLSRCLEGYDADPRHYTTAPAVDDLDDVRAALGYDRINLAGGSYGTRVALVYARRHPERVRTLLLSGVAPLSYRVPLPHPRASHRALQALAEACAADESCRKAHGDVGALFDRITADLERKPRTVPVGGEALPEGTRLTLDADMLRGAVHFSLYDTRAAARLPALLAAADAGRYRPLATWAATLALRFDRQIHLGMFLSVVCSEDEPRVGPADLEGATDGTYMGDAWVGGTYAACEVWPAQEVPSAFFEPVATDAPVLLVSGAVDPATPPRWAERVADRLPNARHVVVPGKGHTPTWPGCAEEVAARFVERAGAEGVDLSCLEERERPPFPAAGRR